ncbi:MAG: DegV family protein [Wujia sp.]
MKDYILVSDSTADLPKEIIREYGIKIVPFSFSINDEVTKYYLDERDEDIKLFYDKLRKGAMPVTSQINPDTYKCFFEELVKEGKSVLYLAFSSGLSGSYQTSLLGINLLKEKYPDAEIVAIDSKSASVGQGAFLYEAALRKAQGYTIEELTDWINSKINKVSHWFMVEDLFHLKRGGRVTTVEAMVGSALKIKPILSVDDDGKLVVKSKTRGVGNALEYLRDRTIEEGGDLSVLRAVIGNADSMEKAERLKAMVVEAGMREENIMIASIGPIIGTHVGAGMAAIAFVRPE